MSIFEKSVNIDKFNEFLEKLAANNEGKKVALFMDNLAVHRSNRARAKMTELGIEPVFNLAYSPDFNPIEFCFSHVKRLFK